MSLEITNCINFDTGYKINTMNYEVPSSFSFFFFLYEVVIHQKYRVL